MFKTACSPSWRAREPGVEGEDLVPTEPDAKQTIRERVRSRLAQAQASPDPHGRIPDFVGAAAAAERLAELPAWQHAELSKQP